ncbi:MAG: NAD-dependent epimerase/dehydratase family protein [bacterium]
MNILLTGGAGFLGKHLTRKLVEEGQSVRVVDLEPFEDDRFDPYDVEFVQGDVAIHAAAALPIQPTKMIRRTDYQGACRTVEAAHNHDVDRFIYVSTTAVYGIPDKHPITEDFPKDPVGPYGQAKYEAEQECLKYSDDMFVSIIRPKTFVGEERLGIMEVLFDWIRRGKNIYILGDGNNAYQLLDVKDLCDAIWTACTHPDADDVFNVGATEFNSIREDMQPVLDEADNGARLVSLPAKPIQSVLAVLEALNLSPIVKWQYATMDKECYVDVTRIRETLGWEPTKTTSETILDNWKWYLKHYERLQNQTGVTHRVPWDQKILKWVRYFS